MDVMQGGRYEKVVFLKMVSAWSCQISDFHSCFQNLTSRCFQPESVHVRFWEHPLEFSIFTTKSGYKLNCPTKLFACMQHSSSISHSRILFYFSDGRASRCPDDGTVPLFSAAELAPSYHDGATGAVLGCPHYARACK
jgi:hypothetical protein